VSLELPMSSLVAHGRSAPKLENTVAKAGTTIRLMTAMAATMAMITKLG
jgi:5-enolpyruvylshikimate-3-phosphate synthase